MNGHIAPLEPADPREVAGHTLLGRLGSGGMGLVYLGADPDSGGRVAVKTIHPHLAGDPSYRRRFKDEAYLASRVASFCTARVLAHGEEEGRPYLVTEYVGGVSLHSRLVGEGPLPAADLHGVAVGVASALAAIHAAGLVHRDLKPANVMLTLSGCRVIDFGIAHSQDARTAAATSGQVLGTPGWMAPEVLIGLPHRPRGDGTDADRRRPRHPLHRRRRSRPVRAAGVAGPRRAVGAGEEPGRASQRVRAAAHPGGAAGTGRR
jgi:serine/threonine protein kinase